MVREQEDVPLAWQCVRCKSLGRMQCPKCLELGLPREQSIFCSQACFKAAWAEHRKVHKVESWEYCCSGGKGRSSKMPLFQWTGSLRPAPIGPTREVPDHIPKPDYAITGFPKIEVESKQQSITKQWHGEDLKGIRAACRVGREVLDAAHAAVKPGVTTDEIDRVVHEATISRGAYPSDFNYYSFPKSVCISVNEVICHGIPDSRPLQEGDIVNVDVSVYYKGFHGDLNETFVVGDTTDAKSKKLVKATHDCMHKAIAACKPGMRYRDIGEIITQEASLQGLSVVRSYCGHGIGDLFHCAPSIPHYARNKAVGVMKIGHVFTIEPMLNVGVWKDVTWPDGWTIVTKDGKRSAQFEHTIVITETGSEILTARLESSPPLFLGEAVKIWKFERLPCRLVMLYHDTQKCCKLGGNESSYS